MMNENEKLSFQLTNKDKVTDDTSKVNLEKPTQDVTPRKETAYTLFTFFLRNFAKFYGIRIVYSMYHILSYSKKGEKTKMSFKLLIQAIFSMPNLRTALFGSVMPTLYKALMLIFTKYFDEKYKDHYVIIAAFISSLVGIMIEEKTVLVNFIILSVLVRVIHILVNLMCETYGIPYYGKKVNFLVFLLVGTALMFINFYHPTYAPVRKIIDGYAIYRDDSERREMEKVRNNLRII